MQITAFYHEEKKGSTMIMMANVTEWPSFSNLKIDGEVDGPCVTRHEPTLSLIRLFLINVLI